MAGADDVLDRNLARIREGITRAATRAGRDPAEVTLVAAAKHVPAAAVRAVADRGVRAVGHNYVQQLRAARRELDELDVRWHYIGALQTGTAHVVADLADVVETLGGERSIRRLAGRAARAGRTLAGLVEVDFTGDRQGVAPGEVPALADLVAGLDGLELCGLMTLPPPTPEAEGARHWFTRLRELRDRVREQHPDVLDLSMGMSLDYEVAVEEGATMVRIGTALFGPRTP